MDLFGRLDLRTRVMVVMRMTFRRTVTRGGAEDTHRLVEEEEGEESREDCGLFDGTITFDQYDYFLRVLS